MNDFRRANDRHHLIHRHPDGPPGCLVASGAVGYPAVICPAATAACCKDVVRSVGPRAIDGCRSTSRCWWTPGWSAMKADRQRSLYEIDSFGADGDCRSPLPNSAATCCGDSEVSGAKPRSRSHRPTISTTIRAGRRLARRRWRNTGKKTLANKTISARFRLDLQDPAQPVALYVAGGSAATSGCAWSGRPSSRRRQARAGRRALFLQMGDRRAGRRPCRAAAAAGFPAGAGDAGHRLQRRAHRAARLQPAARRAVREGRPACGAQARLPDLRAHARAVAALPSRAAHRRAVAHHRARHQGHRDHRPLHHAEHGADDGRIRTDGAIFAFAFGWIYVAVDRRHRLALHLVHGEGQRLAHRASAAR